MININTRCLINFLSRNSLNWHSRSAQRKMRMFKDSVLLRKSSCASGGLSCLRRSILALRARGLFLTDRVKPSLWQRLDNDNIGSRIQLTKIYRRLNLIWPEESTQKSRINDNTYIFISCKFKISHIVAIMLDELRQVVPYNLCLEADCHCYNTNNEETERGVVWVCCSTIATYEVKWLQPIT